MNIWFLPAAVFGVWIAFITFSAVQCSNLGKTAAQHEKDVISTCQGTAMAGDYVDCLKREWDKIHDIPAWMKEK